MLFRAVFLTSVIALGTSIKRILPSDADATQDEAAEDEAAEDEAAPVSCLVKLGLMGVGYEADALPVLLCCSVDWTGPRNSACAAELAADGFDAWLALTKYEPPAAANPSVAAAAAMPTGPKAASDAASGATAVAATAASTAVSNKSWLPTVA